MGEIKIDKVIKSHRKTIALVITQDSALVVRAPFFTPLEYIQKLIEKKRFWINKKQEEIRKRPIVKPKEFVSGEGFLFLGKSYKLEIMDDLLTDIELQDTLRISRTRLPVAKETLIAWYKERALEKIKERCEWYARLIGYKPTSVKITGAKRRWGSCGPRGTLNFSWRLIMTPLEVVDYVVVHELVHLKEKSHAKRFWNKVRAILYDYKKREKWLKENKAAVIL
ncbi:MAG: metal-dependent hydrolase [Deltaproteobacteria bacterium GWC2_42_11]|nr:MAG: metal-dependent hydrolase [Deltaproteobacteria bacterium GWC2_42_11]HBO84370.1 M48 family peptidase [Deltaproteobacteria bacterium]